LPLYLRGNGASARSQDFDTLAEISPGITKSSTQFTNTPNKLPCKAYFQPWPQIATV
jgi:hypothetical protein